MVNNNSNNGFSIYSHNIRSLPNKINPLTTLISKFDEPYTIIALQEIWSISKELTLPGYQNLTYSTRDKNARVRNPNCGGGVGIFVKEGVNFQTLDFENQFVQGVYESIWLSIPTSKNRNIIIGNTYRPNTFPHADLGKASSIHFQIIDKIKKDKKYKDSKIYIMGDFNIDLLKYNDHLPTGEFLDTMISKGFLPLITKPTHLTSSSATLIDNIFTNSMTVKTTSILLDDLSDHIPTIITDSINVPTTNEEPTPTHDITQKSVAELNQILTNTNWDNVLTNNDPQEAFDSFFKLLTTATDVAFPLKVKKKQKSPKSVEWMSSGLKTSSLKKDKLFKAKKKHPSILNCEIYQNYKKLYNTLCRKAEILHTNRLFDTYVKDIKSTWKLINKTLGRPIKKGNNIPSFFIENKAHFP